MISNSAATHAKVAIYIRVSTLHQIDRDSLPMQRQDLIAYAKLILNTDDVTVFEDAGYSGKNTIRPEFQKMMSQLRTGTYTHLLVWKIDRISRNLLDFAEMYQELKDLGVTFVSKNEQFDTSTAMGEAMLKIILVFAELERNMTSERVAATMISRASNGQWNGGRIPYGYDYDPEEQTFSFNSDEYNIAHLIHDKYEELRSLVYLARYLNEHGYRTRAGNDWSPVSLDIILRSVFYCGDYQYNRLKEGDRQRPKDKSEWITVKDHHPAIVSRGQKERILALLESNRRLKSFRKSGKSKYTHIFSGLLIPKLMNVRGNQVCAALTASAPMFIAGLGMLLLPHLMPVWAFVGGCAQGASLVVALALIALRGRDSAETVVLSGVAQSFGYLIASLGPLMFGVLVQATGGHHVPLMVFTFVAFLQCVVAVIVGRPSKM